MNLIRKDVFFKEIIYILLVIPFIRIEAFAHLTTVDRLYDYAKVLSFIIIIILLLNICIKKRQLKINKYLILFICFLLTVIISSVVHKTNILAILVYYLPALSLILLFHYSYLASDLNVFFTGVSKLFSIYIICNLVGIILFPDGIFQEVEYVNNFYSRITPVNFLGKDNALGPILISMITLIFLKDIYVFKKIKKSSIFLLGCVFINIVIMWSATSVVGFIFYLGILALVCKNKYINNIINYRIIFYLIIILTIGIVFFQFQNHFSYLISNILNKDVTLSNRTNVWNMTFEYVYENFHFLEYILGIGEVNYSYSFYLNRYAHCHNQMLNIFIQGGGLGVIIYIKMILLGLKKRKTLIHNIVGACILSFCVMFIAEVYNSALIFLLIYISYMFCRYSEK